MTKGEGGFQLLLVGPTVADIDTLLVLLVDNLLAFAPDAWEGCFAEAVSSALVQALVPGERQVPAGADVAQQDGCQSCASLAAEEPSLHDSRNLLAPRHADGVAADVDVDGVFVDVGNGGDELFLVVGQVHRLAVVTLAVLIVALVQSSEDNHIVGSLSLLYSLSDEFFGCAVVFEVLPCGDTIVVAACIAHIAASIFYLAVRPLQMFLKTLQGADFVLGFQRAGATAYGHHLDGVLAYDKNLLAIGLDWQHVALVLQEDDAFPRHELGYCIMLFVAKETVRLLLVHRGAEEEAQDAAHLLVQFLCGVFTIEDCLLVLLGEVIHIVGVRSTHREAVRPGAELHIESVLDSLVQVVRSAPVAYDNTVETPVLLQYLAQRVLVVTIVLILVEIVGTHHAPGFTLLDGSLEARQIYFMQGSVAYDDVHLMAVLLIVVQTVMLHATGHADAL